MEMRKKVNFVSFLVDRPKIFIKMRSAEVRDMIYILYYYLRRAKRAGAENGINPEKKNFSHVYAERGVPPLPPVQSSATVFAATDCNNNTVKCAP